MTGKSTLIKLLTRLFDPTEGEILINDVDIKNYSPDELHENMSVLFQDYRTLLFPRSPDHRQIHTVASLREYWHRKHLTKQRHTNQTSSLRRRSRPLHPKTPPPILYQTPRQ